MAYFLLFALSRRTAIFWGHAVTSAVSQFDTEANEAGRRGLLYQSTLFELLADGRHTYYAEQLYLMRSMTTRFAAGQAPFIARNRRCITRHSGMRLYLVPQTLYKLHPTSTDY